MSKELDQLLKEVPTSLPLSEAISPSWALKMLLTASDLAPESRGLVLKLSGRVVHRVLIKDLVEVPPEVITEMVQSVRGQTDTGRNI